MKNKSFLIGFFMNKFIVLLAGGKGERFQSFTQTSCPKQFYRKNSDAKNMLELTFERMQALKSLNNSIVTTLTKEAYKDYLVECNFLGSNKIIIEPDSCKNTGPAIFNLIYTISKEHGDAILAFFPVDQQIDDEPKFINLINRTMRLAEKVKRVFLIGSTFTEMNSQLGYITTKNQSSSNFDFEINDVESFIEKPSKEEDFEKIKTSHSLVNMGIFIGSVSMFLELFLQAAVQTKGKGFSGGSFDSEILPYCASNLMVATFDGKWVDLGIEKKAEEELETLNQNTSCFEFEDRISSSPCIDDITYKTKISGDFVCHEEIKEEKITQTQNS